jgi:hypothetical protein
MSEKTSFGLRILGGNLCKNHAITEQNISSYLMAFYFFIQLQSVSLLVMFLL